MRREVDVDALKAARKKPVPMELRSLRDQMLACKSTGAYDQIAKAMDAAKYASSTTQRRWKKARKAAQARLKKEAA